MTKYIENPKMAGSGILACIPQGSKCPQGCDDCFFQSGRSYLEPLEENLPNMPPFSLTNVVRVNDGNDSNVNQGWVIDTTKHYPMKFYNTSIAKNLERFPGPVVLTVNPGKITDYAYKKLTKIPRNLMFVRVRVNTWNLSLVHGAVHWYVGKNVPVVLTFMAYHDEGSIQAGWKDDYFYRKRTVNSYWAIKPSSWFCVMARFRLDPLVHSCGQEGLSSLCRHCGNCLREYFATADRL